MAELHESERGLYPGWDCSRRAAPVDVLQTIHLLQTRVGLLERECDALSGRLSYITNLKRYHLAERMAKLYSCLKHPRQGAPMIARKLRATLARRLRALARRAGIRPADTALPAARHDGTTVLQRSHPGSRPHGRRVCILVQQFFDQSGKNMFTGGAERYLIELARLVRDMGYVPEVYQSGDGDWVRYYNDLRVVGLDTGGDCSRLNDVFHDRVEEGMLTIYLWFFLATPRFHCRSIGVCHGVHWDHDGLRAERESGFADILQSMDNAGLMVSVDTNSINWVRANRPELAWKFLYVPNFVDTDEYRPAPREAGPGRLVVLFPRRLCVERGIGLLEEVVPGLLARYPHVDVEIVGKALPPHDAQARALVENHPGRVRWYYLPPERMAEAYRTADITLIPTVHSEGTSLSCLEAQASGNAVIATNIGGLTDLILHDHNGLLIEPTAAALREALCRLIEDPELRERLGRTAREVAATFSLERWRGQWEGLIRSCVSDSEPGAPAARPCPVAYFLNSDWIVWERMKQRPHHLAAWLANHGVETFWLNVNNRRHSGCPHVHLVAPGEDLRLERPLVVISNPHKVEELDEHLRRFKDPVIVYDVLDSVEIYNTSDDRAGREPGRRARDNHERLLERADLVMTSALSLLEQLKARRPDTLYIPNGVDRAHFAAARAGLPRPADLGHVKRPVVGFYGAISDVFDFDLYRAVAAARPGYSFVLIGPLTEDTKLAPLLRLPNVFHLGEKPYEELPGYLAAFDVGVMTKITSEVTRCMRPLKVLEYLAAGVPVVATPTPEIDGWPGVLTAGDAESFALCLDRAVSQPATFWRAEEVDAFVASEDWAQVLEPLWSRLRQALPENRRTDRLHDLSRRAPVTAQTFAAPAPAEVVAPPLRIDKVGPPRQGRRVCILINQFFDKRGKDMFCGGAERYLIELARLIRDLGFEPEVYQGGDSDWARSYNDLQVFGLDTEGDDSRLNEVFHDRVEQGLLTIYLAFYLASPQFHHRSIGVSHGVYWDHGGAASAAGGSPAEIHNAIEHVATMVSVDTNTTNWVRGTWPNLADRFLYIPNFVNTEEYRPSASDTEAGQLVVLFPRRVCAERGFWLAREVVPGLLERFPHVVVQFVGKGLPREEAAARSLVDRYPGRVQWFSLPPERMAEVYRAADITIIPTVHSEGTSLSCLEAQASGNAVIATNVGGLTDLILHEHNGLLIEPTAAALDAALTRLILDPELRARLGRNAREVAETFTLDRWRRQWAGLLESRLLTTDVPNMPRRLRPVAYIANPNYIVWGRMTQRPHHLARWLANHGFDVFWLEASGRRSSGHPHVHLVAPGDDVHLENPWIVLYSPLGAEQIGLFEEQFKDPVIVYDVLDNIEIFDEFDRRERREPGRRARDLHEQLLDRADVVMASAVTLVDLLKSCRPDTLYIPNGVDRRHFASAATAAPRPAELAGLAGPIVGYYGAIAEWFDFDLYEAVAASRPDYRFVLVGPSSEDDRLARICSLPNVTYVGEKTYEELPRYVAAFDVGTLTFVRNEVTRCVRPLKVLEYLAAGLPAVSTPLPEMADWPGVLTAPDPEAFARCVDRAISDRASFWHPEQVAAFVASEDWEQVFQPLMARLMPSPQENRRLDAAHDLRQREPHCSSRAVARGINSGT